VEKDRIAIRSVQWIDDHCERSSSVLHVCEHGVEIASFGFQRRAAKHRDGDPGYRERRADDSRGDGANLGAAGSGVEREQEER
jgi:hypothetical protein